MSLQMHSSGLDSNGLDSNDSSTGLSHINTLSSSLRHKIAKGYALRQKHRRSQKRIGVPGHRHYDYLNNIEAWLEFAGSTWQQIFFCPIYWFYTGVYVVLLIVYGIWNDLPGVQSWRISAFLAGTLTSVAIFTITFYNANVFELYWKKVNIVFETNESVEQVHAMAGSFWSRCPDFSEKLIRYSNAIVNLNYLSITGDIESTHWDGLEECGMLKSEEVMALKNTKIWYPTVLQSWLVRGLRESYSEGRVMSADCESLLNTLAALRANSSRQACLSKTQVPRPYFHIMWLSVQSFAVVIIWCTAVLFATAIRGDCELDGLEVDGLGRRERVCIGSAVSVAVTGLWLYTLVFALFQVGCGLSDPIGNSPTDYDLTADLDRLWNDASHILTSGAKIMRL